MHHNCTNLTVELFQFFSFLLHSCTGDMLSRYYRACSCEHVANSIHLNESPSCRLKFKHLSQNLLTDIHAEHTSVDTCVTPRAQFGFVYSTSASSVVPVWDVGSHIFNVQVHILGYLNEGRRFTHSLVF